MRTNTHFILSRRERQIMDILYRLGRATANDVLAELPGGPNSSTVRTQLRVLEEKGHVRHEAEGLRYVYMPTMRRDAVGHSALRHLIDTFFEGSTEKVLATLLGKEGRKLSDEQLERLAAMIQQARKANRR